ncbi:MAG TPA: aspartyl protease family protein [Pyrinomonadaceae bacterium]|jgi:predicted aspartyl protease|nr:aspartyl protease family protein [Pyrinomonadaceae bacterium]
MKPSVYRSLWLLSFAALLAGSMALPQAQAQQARKARARAGTDDRAGVLKNLFDTHQWFKLREALQTTTGSAFYRGALASAFNDTNGAARNLTSVIRSAPQSEQAFDARLMLINSYMRAGRYSQALMEADKALVVKPDDAGLKNARGLFHTLSQYPQQEVARHRPSTIHYSMKGGNLFIPVAIDGNSADYLVDTGANFSLISEAEAKRLKLAIHGSGGYEMGDSSGGNVGFRIAVADLLTVGDVQLKHVAFFVVADDQQPFVDLPPGQRGVIGLPVLMALRTLRWKQDGSFEVGFASKARAGLKSNLCFDGLQPMTRGEFQQKQINIFVDTGATRTRALPLFAHEFASFVGEGGKKDSDRMTGVGGSVEIDALTLSELRLRIGGLDTLLRDGPVLLKEPTADSRWWHVWLGMDLLNQAQMVTLDFDSMTLALN